MGAGQIDRAARSLVASFANGVVRDRAAVQNAITSQWSNGQTEGQITKLKLIKRQMYGERPANAFFGCREMEAIGGGSSHRP